MIYRSLFLIISLFVLGNSFIQPVIAQSEFEVVIDSSAYLTDIATETGRALKFVTSEDRLILFDFENFRILFYKKGEGFEDNEFLKIVGQHSRIQNGQPFDPDTYNRLSAEFGGTIFNNQLWVTNYSYGEILIFDLDGNYITSLPGRYRVFDTEDDSLYALEGSSIYRWEAGVDTFAYLKDVPDEVSIKRENYGANIKLESNRLCVFDQDTLNVYNLAEYLNGLQTDTIFSVVSSPMPEFEIMADKILWSTDYYGNYAFSDLDGNNRDEGNFGIYTYTWHFNPDNFLYVVGSWGLKKFDSDLDELVYTSRNPYYWDGRFFGADDQNLYFYDFHDGGFVTAPLNYDDGTYFVSRHNDIPYSGWNRDFRLQGTNAFLLSEWPPDSMKIFNFDIEAQNSSMFRVDSVYGFDILNDSIFTMVDTTLKIYSPEGQLLFSSPLQGREQTNLHNLNRNSNVHIAVNQHFFFAVFDDTLNIFSKSGHFLRSYPFNIRSNSYANALLTADDTHVFSNRLLYAINIETGEMNTYLDNSYGSGFINGNRYWDESGENIYSYQIINIINNIEQPSQIIKNFHLVGAYPNPFNPTTTIIYRIAKTTDVKLSVYTILGQQVAELVNGKQPAGEYKIQWNAGNFSSGMYFYVLQVEGKQQIKRGVLLK